MVGGDLPEFQDHPTSFSCSPNPKFYNLICRQVSTMCRLYIVKGADWHENACGLFGSFPDVSLF